MWKCLCQLTIHSPRPTDETKAGLTVSFAGTLGHSHENSLLIGTDRPYPNTARTGDNS
jgi:hypothetical protein